eukprot:6246927-Pyramimonas_sp.AAC.1
MPAKMTREHFYAFRLLCAILGALALRRRALATYATPHPHRASERAGVAGHANCAVRHVSRQIAIPGRWRREIWQSARSAPKTQV